MADKLDMKSMDITGDNIAKIKALFPSAVTEVMGDDGKVKLAIDFDALKQELSEDLISEKAERYQMTWPDKSKAKVLANSRINATLRPDKEKSVDFDNTENLYIEGDNLDVLKLLRETYLGKVKMIYIDPPYNTGNDFVYEDDFAMSADDYAEVSGQYDEQGNRLVKNLDSNGRFHTDWLNMIYPRLKVAKDLLSDDGFIAISIGEEESDNLRKVCDEIIGESNFRNIIEVRRYDKNLNLQFASEGLQTMNVGLEYIYVYSRHSSAKMTAVYKSSSDERAEKGYWKGFWNNADRPTMRYDILGYTPIDGQWKWKQDVAMEAIANYQEYLTNFSSQMTIEEYYDKTGRTKRFIRRRECGNGKNMGVEHWVAPADGILRNSNWSDLLISKPAGLNIPFDSPKNSDVIKELIKLFGVTENDTVLDFFSGSATTAHAVMQLNAEDGGNRKFIMVQLPEKCDMKSEAYKAGYKTICDIGQERICRAGKKIVNDLKVCGQERKIEGYTLLRSGYGGAYQYAEWKNNETGEIKTESRDVHEPKDFYKYYPNELDIGFRVLKLDSSNMQEVYYNPAAMTQDLLASTVDNVKSDRTALDLLFQVMLDLGIELSAKIDEHAVNGKTYYAVNENDIIACFDDDIDNDVITAIAKQNPLYAVFKDKSFATDSVGINNEQLFKTYSPSTVVKVI